MGAAIAMGSQVLNGYWALLVIAPSPRQMALVSGRLSLVMCQWLLANPRAIARMIATSPTRLVSAVIRLAEAA